MNIQQELTHDYLTTILHYDPITGNFTWLQKRRGTATKGSIAGFNNGNGYQTIYVGRKRYRLHRLAWFYMTKEWPKDMIDHINGNGLDNRWCNLREATRSQNAQNSKLRNTNTTGVKGLTRDVTNNRWKAQIVVDGIVHMKQSTRLDTCLEWLDTYRSKLHGAFANNGEVAV